MVELAVREFEWKEVGLLIMDRFDWVYGFDLQPIDELKAVLTVKEFTNWKVGNIPGLQVLMELKSQVPASTVKYGWELKGFLTIYGFIQITKQ